MGGNLIDFPGDKTTKVADIVTVKCLLNNVLSTTGARAACIDIKDFYLNNDLPEAEYVRFTKASIPPAFWQQYDLDRFADDHGNVYGKVLKGMYGLPHAGKVANDHLLPRLAEANFNPTPITPGLFKHLTNSVIFTLIVDDFLVLYTNITDFELLTTTLRKWYTITVDMEATKFCGMTLDWDYTNRHCTISMPGYVEQALQRFTHPTPTKPQHSPHPWIAPIYGASIQYAAPEDNSPPLTKQGITRLQQIIGTLLFYARAVDNTMLVALGTIALAQTKGTIQTMDAMVQLLDYAASHPDAAIRFHASDMILYVHSDASYLSEPHSKSRVGGIFYLGNKNDAPRVERPNGPIHVETRILKNVMAAASEAEVGALFHNGQETVFLRKVLQEMGREQPGPTRIVTDNSTAAGFANSQTKLKRSKAMDMRFHWVPDRVNQGQLEIAWEPGEHNHADYFTKHHPTTHHMRMRSIYLHTSNLALAIAHLAAAMDPPVATNNSSPSDCRGVLIPDPGSNPVTRDLSLE